MHGAVAEGVLTSRAAHDLAKKLGVEVPIIDGIHQVIHGEVVGQQGCGADGCACVHMQRPSMCDEPWCQAEGLSRERAGRSHLLASQKTQIPCTCLLYTAACCTHVRGVRSACVACNSPLDYLLCAACVLLLLAAAAAEGQDPLAVIHGIMSRDLKPELDTMVLAAAAQKSAVPQ